MVTCQPDSQLCKHDVFTLVVPVLVAGTARFHRDFGVMLLLSSSTSHPTVPPGLTRDWRVRLVPFAAMAFADLPRHVTPRHFVPFWPGWEPLCTPICKAPVKGKSHE
jgi:hypothetical protein